MKFGKPTRFRNPRTFQAKQNASSFSGRSHQVVPLDPPAEGEIRLALDDERPCPNGWVMTKNPHEFFTFLEDKDQRDRIAHLSLDWYLGVGISDGLSVAKRLASEFRNDPLFLPRLEFCNFHSSDSDKAREMLFIVRDAVGEDRKHDIFFDLGPLR